MIPSELESRANSVNTEMHNLDAVLGHRHQQSRAPNWRFLSHPVVSPAMIVQPVKTF